MDQSLDAGPSSPAPERSVELAPRRPLAVRWFHWINFPVLATMVWSGLLIFWASHDSGSSGQGAITVFGRSALPSWVYHPHAPSWWPNWLPHATAYDASDHPYRAIWSLAGRLAEGMAWHYLFFWPFAINGLAYVAYLALSGQWRAILPKRRSFAGAVLVALHDLRLVRRAPPADGYNDAQRVAYTLVILMGALMLLSGFAVYKPTQAYWLDALLGGYLMARWIHFWTTMALCAFFAVHVAQVARAGWNNFRGMVTGYALEPARRDPAGRGEEAA